jgi:hypothetical protein
MKSLSELFTEYGSDKTKGGFADLYEVLFKHIRLTARGVLEIGIGPPSPATPGQKPGASLLAWRDWFEFATITGVDIQPNNTLIEGERITTFICDSTDRSRVMTLMGGLHIFFDVIIDDGCHKPAAQVETFINFWPWLKKGGYYVIEDIDDLDTFCPYFRETVTVCAERFSYGRHGLVFAK